MKTGTKIAIGVVALAAVGGVAWYLWSRGKQVAGGGDVPVGAAALDLGVGSSRRYMTNYASSMPKGLKLTGLGVV